MTEDSSLRFAQSCGAAINIAFHMVALTAGAGVICYLGFTTDRDLSRLSEVGLVVIPVMLICFLVRYATVILPGLLGRGGMWIEDEALHFGSPFFCRIPMTTVKSAELVELRSFGRDRPYLRLTLAKGKRELPAFLLSGEPKDAFLALRGEIRRRQSAAGER